MTKRALGWVALAVFIASVVTANYLTTHYGFVPVGFGLAATAGTFAIGGAIMFRDLLQDGLGRVAVLAAIAAGAALSYVVADHRIAAASAITFLLAELLEFGVYTPLRVRVGWGSGAWSGVVSIANLTGALADTLIFLALAGFPITAVVVAGQLVGKAYVTAAVIAAAVVVRRAVPGFQPGR